jgi:chromosome segregation ATPase
VDATTQTVPASEGNKAPRSDISDVEQQLIEAQKARTESEKQARAAERALETTRENLEQKLRTTAENGSLRVKLLEETVQRLSCRSQPQAELARLSMEISRLSQSEAKLRSDLMFAEDRVQRLRKELEHAEGLRNSRECSGVTTGAPLFAGEDSARDHALLAAMIDRAEKAEIELSKTKQSMDALKEKMGFSAIAQDRGATALMAASRVCSFSTSV